MRSENALEKFLEIILPVCWKGNWLSVEEMTELTGLHPSTVRWCMKQLKAESSNRKERAYMVRRRMRQPIYKGKHEYYIKRKPAQMRMTFQEPTISV